MGIYVQLLIYPTLLYCFTEIFRSAASPVFPTFPLYPSFLDVFYDVTHETQEHLYFNLSVYCSFHQFSLVRVSYHICSPISVLYSYKTWNTVVVAKLFKLC